MDRYGSQAGRHYVTSLSCLTLEIYYRYLPLYKVDAESAGQPAEAAPASASSKDAREVEPSLDYSCRVGRGHQFLVGLRKPIER